MLRKRFSLLSIVLILAMLCATGALAAPHHFGPSYHRFDRAPMASVYFFPQDMDTYSHWLRYNAWGIMSYRLWGEKFRFSFRGFNLDRRTNYTLIYYPDAESGADMICLGSARSNRRGNLNIHARLDICSMPNTTDPNYFNGAQIMLVPSESVKCEQGELLTPGSEENLISYHAIRFTDTDGCPALDPEIPTDETEDEGETSEDEDDSSDETEDPSTPPDDYDNNPDIVYPY